MAPHDQKTGKGATHYAKKNEQINLTIEISPPLCATSGQVEALRPLDCARCLSLGSEALSFSFWTVLSLEIAEMSWLVQSLLSNDVTDGLKSDEGFLDDLKDDLTGSAVLTNQSQAQGQSHC